MIAKKLSRGEEKKIFDELSKQYGIKFKNKFLWFESGKGRLWILNKNVDVNEFKRMRIKFLGTYVAFKEKDGIRLTIEGSQIFGKEARKNVIEVTEKDLHEWLRGYDLQIKTNFTGYVIIKRGNDFAGCGKALGNKILNMVPKSRRIMSLRSFHIS
ncbi:MAG: hypothetical protein OH319_01620 [Candidatus Parvarchaeota archaeon]|nr:hypothetical protein [Candidatus Jingweiarchaeum tengchongense]MCW1297730.1 hypothetical protein [Candidatus Jingweiarchaeum tengchongense]MCW1299740.1 hypothetical protein [Candidatus Jingweiarchaeum tengchongense]MCW1304289.1 hypothetical protein [Candidatus Jingweiarchaeum tengchongense]MCW1305316.1 hypothetical protein [Candidatus Jingweiarchaeum tengchongense]